MGQWERGSTRYMAGINGRGGNPPVDGQKAIAGWHAERHGGAFKQQQARRKQGAVTGKRGSCHAKQANRSQVGLRTRHPRATQARLSQPTAVSVRAEGHGDFEPE